MLDSLSSLGTDVVVINLHEQLTIFVLLSHAQIIRDAVGKWCLSVCRNCSKSAVAEVVGGCRDGRRLQRCSYAYPAKMYGCTKENKFKDLFSMFVYYELNVYYISYSEHYSK